MLVTTRAASLWAMPRTNVIESYLYAQLKAIRKRDIVIL